MYDPRTKNIIKEDTNTLWSRFVKAYRKDLRATNESDAPSVLFISAAGALAAMFFILIEVGACGPSGAILFTYIVYFTLFVIGPICARPSLFMYPLLITGIVVMFHLSIPKMITYHCNHCEAIETFYIKHKKMAKEDLCVFHEYYKNNLRQSKKNN